MGLKASNAHLTAATTGWVPQIMKVIVPPGVTAALVDVEAVNFNGAAYIYDVIGWQL